MVAEPRLEPARPVARACLLPLRRFDHRGAGQVIQGHVLAVAAGAAEASRAEHAGDGGQCRDVLLVVPLVELGLELRRDVHGVEEKPAGVPGRQLVAGQDLLALVPHQPLDLGGHALGPWREVLAADRPVRRALHDRHVLEVVRRHGDLRIVHTDPPPAHEEPGHALTLRQMLGVVPVVEFVPGRAPDLHRRDQRALRHGRLLPQEESSPTEPAPQPVARMPREDTDVP